MKVVILAAGYGHRMGELTEYIPKPLIPIVNKPILQHLIEILSKVGLNDIIIVVGHLKNQIKSFLSTFQEKGINLTIIEAKNYRKGPIYSFSACLDEIRDMEFILIPADFLMEPSILLGFLQKSEPYQVVLAVNALKKSNLRSTVHISTSQDGIQVLGITSNVIGGKSELKSLLPILRCRINFQPYIQKSIKLGHKRVIEAVELYLHENNVVTAFPIESGYWFDLDTIQDILSANAFLLNQLNSKIYSSNISDDVSSQNITLTKPTLIGKKCTFENNCSIGPNVSIGDNTVIGENVKIQNAIVCSSSRIPANLKIQNAIFFRSIFQ